MVTRGGAPAFGDVTGEYLALRSGAGYVTDWHDVVWVKGPDAVAFLDGLVSQAVEPMSAGDVAPSLLLAPRGKLRAPHLLLKGTNEVGLLTDKGVGEVAVEDLIRFKIRVDVAIGLGTQPVLSVWGPAAADAVHAATGLAPAAGWLRQDDVAIVRVPFQRASLPRFAIIGAAAAALDAAGIGRAGASAADAVRIEAGEAIMGVDIDEGTIPQEADLVDGAVDFTKGCYLGQELVARIDSRGHVNRCLRAVVLTSNVLPPLGADVVLDDKTVGTVTSLAESLELRAPVGMSLLRREAEPGTAVSLRWQDGETAAVVRALPLDPFDE